MADLRENLTVVVHQIRSPDNLGALARLLANFGYHHLVLSQPRTYTFRAAEKLAVHAESHLEALQLAPDLPSALESCVFACGTTSRREIKGRRVLTPEEGIERLAEAARGGPVALVFGGEKRGLSDADLAVCQEVLAIPTEASQPSMNLAQAAAVLLYLSSRPERPGSREERPSAQIRPNEGARLETIHALEACAREVMLESGFLNPQAPDHVLHELSRALVRGRLTQREAEMWLSAFEHQRRALRRWQQKPPVPPRDRARR